VGSNPTPGVLSLVSNPTLLFASDEDFLNVVGAVKESSKRIAGVYFARQATNSLIDALDVSFWVEESIAQN
jgi:hypothetical protein